MQIMFKMYHCGSVFPRVAMVNKYHVRFINFLRMKNALKDMLGMDSKRAPYGHICQVGDPVLRRCAITVEPERIKTAEFQKVINQLISVMRDYKACGLSGPQIGFPYQIFAIEFTDKHMKRLDEDVIKSEEIKIVPTQIFINPQLKITDYTSTLFYEGCESIRGFSAAVPRPYEVEITALNASAEQFTWKVCGWPARLVQHEYDHLQGKLFIDKMDNSTFNFTAWERVNKRNGKVQISYWPRN